MRKKFTLRSGNIINPSSFKLMGAANLDGSETEDTKESLDTEESLDTGGDANLIEAAGKAAMAAVPDPKDSKKINDRIMKARGKSMQATTDMVLGVVGGLSKMTKGSGGDGGSENDMSGGEELGSDMA
jgi:hypothetical protein